MNLNQSQRKSPRKTTAYSLNKKAFDTVILMTRRMDSPTLGSNGVMKLSRGGASARNAAAPNSVEFRCDVMLAIRAAMPKGVSLTNFFLAYFLFDSDDEIERNVYAQKVLGGRVHSVEQRVGAEFLRRGIYPTAAYMFPKRLKRPVGWI